MKSNNTDGFSVDKNESARHQYLTLAISIAKKFLLLSPNKLQKSA